MRRTLSLAALLAGLALAFAVTKPPPVLPDPKITPGAVLPNVTLSMVCTPGYAKRTRLPIGAKWRREMRLICQRYGVPYNPKTQEMDHLQSIELGGDPSNPANVWPESYGAVYQEGEKSYLAGARQKDTIENRLHKLACSDLISLAQAQKEIATNWIASYQKHIGPLPVLPPAVKAAAK